MKTIPVEERTFGRKIEFDDESWNYSMGDLLTTEESKNPRSYTWRCLRWLDQGREGACVGFAWAHELVARPKELTRFTTEHARKIYKTAQTLDKWPGEDYEGTSVLGGIKAVQQLYPKMIPEYRWCFTFKDFVTTIGYRGPIVVGVYWYEGLSRPDKNGRVTVSGKRTGGHAILVNGVNVKKKIFRMHNSWGVNWGHGGDCFISFDDMGLLLSERGEACVPVKRGGKKKY